MKAFAITARGSQPSVQDIAQPEPAADQVLIKVEAASINGFDLSVREIDPARSIASVRPSSSLGAWATNGQQQL
jgi:NADPH:quinone reductase-like Zn-dependent oxidoreductase